MAIQWQQEALNNNFKVIHYSLNKPTDMERDRERERAREWTQLLANKNSYSIVITSVTTWRGWNINLF